jgi:transketolase
MASAQGVRRGGYVLKDAVNRKPQLILIASGSEVGLVVAAADRLQQEDIAVRCVSMPSGRCSMRCPSSIETRCCRRRCVLDSRSRRARPKVGIAILATQMM